MATPITLSKDAVYATKPNIVYPGNQTAATAAETAADTRVDDALASGGIDNVTIAIAAGSIEIANP